MRIGVTGTLRGATKLQLVILGSYINSPRVGRLVHGGAPGVDSEADALFEREGRDAEGRRFRRTTDVYPAKGSRGTYARPTYRDIAREPLERDRLIVANCDLMLVVPRQDHEIRRSGTWATCRYAVAAGVITLVILPDGDTRPAEYLLGGE